MLKDEQIFDILDGVAKEDTLQQHLYLMAHSDAYQKYYHELKALHLDLTTMPLEKTSVNFTENILAAIPAAQPVVVVVRKKSWAGKLSYVFFGVVMMVLLATVTLALLSTQSIGNIDTFQMPNFEGVRNFLTGDFIKILVLINLIALLRIFDRKVLRPYFSHRKITLG